MLAGVRIIIKRTDNHLDSGNAPPNGVFHVLVAAIGRQTVFKKLLSILQNVLRDIAEVEIEFTSAVIGVLDERIHHPELYIFVVCGFEIGVVHFTHDTAPTGSGVVEVTAGIHTGGQALAATHIVVVRTSFTRIESQVEHGNVGRGGIG